MKDKFIFWAQALDNSSPDHIDMHGEALSPHDTVRRQEAISRVSNVVKGGTCIFESNDVHLTADAHHFVVEVPSAQRDERGRTTFIVCCGEYSLANGDTLGATVATGLEEFAQRIGRSIQPDHAALVRAAFVALQQRDSTKKLVRAVAFGAAALVLFALGYWLAARGGWLR